MASTQTHKFDVLVVGGGIAGLQAALDLADQDFSVAIVEKGPSIGGKMIRLSKVFPTLDCASCITTPKMAAAAHHENISLFTCCDVKSIDKKKSVLTAGITQQPRYVDAGKCIGCRKCEYQCPVLIPDSEQGGFSARKAICIPFSNAIPQIAVLDAENCLLCGKCEKICPTQAIDYFQKPSEFIIEAKSAVLATGYEMTSLADKPQYGMGKIPNVIDALLMERGTRAWGFPIVPGSAACMPSSRPCCFPGPCPWRTFAFIIWISGRSEKDMSSFTRTPRPWALNLSRPKWPASIPVKPAASRFGMKTRTARAWSR
jgi:heterodisulfide reductase subunit A